MDVRKYELLLKAVELKNLTKAAASLGYTQSGASHVIRAIEAELGVTLLRRDYSGTSLTTEGELLLPAIRELVNCDDKIRSIAQSILGLHTGILRVAAFSSVSQTWLPRIIRRFHTLYPNVQVEIITGSGTYREMEEYLMTAQVDCSFVHLPVNSSLQSIPLLRDPLLAVIPKDSPLAQAPEPITFAQLEEEPFLCQLPSNEQGELFDSYNFRPKPAFFMQEGMSLLAMAENGLGCTILAGLLVNSRIHNAVLKRLEHDPCRLIGIATRASQAPSPVVTAFIELTVQVAEEYKDIQKL